MLVAAALDLCLNEPPDEELRYEDYEGQECQRTAKRSRHARIGTSAVVAVDRAASAPLEGALLSLGLLALGHRPSGSHAQLGDDTLDRIAVTEVRIEVT